MKTQDVIQEMVDNNTDFFDQVAGETLKRLHDMYGDSLSHKDIDKVVAYLYGAAKQANLPKE